jgi:hypothetical protein
MLLTSRFTKKKSKVIPNSSQMSSRNKTLNLIRIPFLHWTAQREKED